jgi:hypothetical protein
MDQNLDWTNTQSHWDLFLEEVRLARAAIGATYAGAWFRGQTDSWDLTPSLYRQLPEFESAIVKLRNDTAIYVAKLKRARAFLQGNALSIDDKVTQRLAAKITSFCKQLSRLEQRRPVNGHTG